MGFLCLFMVAACKKETDSVGTTITAATISAPANNTSINLDPASNAVVTFEWSPAMTENYTLPFYKVVFDKETGDFSTPIYTGIPQKVGSEAKLSLSHKEMNKVANAAGIKELASGKVKWKVIASNGVVSATSGSGLIELKRPVGFAENPVALFITGTATEGGADLTKSMAFKKLSDGVFEIYTSLIAGSYKLIDKTTGAPLTFVVDAGVVREGTETASPVTAKTVYRINLDFNKSIAVFTEIQSVGLWFSGFNTISNVLAYDAAGVWKATDLQVTWKTESWGKDERYKFRATEKAPDGLVSVKNWGSSIKDNIRATASTAASYYFLKPVDNTQYDYAYKFAQEGKAAIEFRMNATAEYTHKVTFK